MWIATLRSKEFINGRLHLIVDFSNGTDHSVKEFIFDTSDQNLQSSVIVELNRLNNLSNLTKTILLGPVDTNVVVAVPTQEDLDKSAYFQLSNKLNIALAQVSSGILAPDDKLVSDLETSVKSAFKPEYVGL